MKPESVKAENESVKYRGKTFTVIDSMQFAKLVSENRISRLKRVVIRGRFYQLGFPRLRQRDFVASRIYYAATLKNGQSKIIWPKEEDPNTRTEQKGESLIENR